MLAAGKLDHATAAPLVPYVERAIKPADRQLRDRDRKNKFFALKPRDDSIICGFVLRRLAKNSPHTHVTPPSIHALNVGRAADSAMRDAGEFRVLIKRLLTWIKPLAAALPRPVNEPSWSGR